MNQQNRHAASALLQSVVSDMLKYCRSCGDNAKSTERIEQWRDYVTTIINSRGLSICLVTLPDLGKVYDKGLSSGVIASQYTNQNGSRVSLLDSPQMDLLHLSFSDDGRCIASDPNIVFFTRCLLYLFKKVKMDCPSESIRKAVHDFEAIESELRVPSGTWNSDTWVSHRFRFSDSPELLGGHPRAAKLWGIADDVFSAICPATEVDTTSIRPRHGPGAVADMRTGGDKYLFPFWPSKLEGTFPWCAFAQHREDLHISEEMTSILSPKEPPARLIAVPKSFKGPRLIASEPTAHQFLQQGLMQWIRSNLSPLLRISIDFRSQEPSKEAALLASRRGDTATVDLSSASDRLSCWTVERAFGANQSLLSALHSVRTRVLIDGTGTNPEMSILLRKFAAQGSAVTFPIQTIVYTGLCLSALCFVENKRPTKAVLTALARKVRVFGDDIIIPNQAVPILNLMLDQLQLKVNVSKTHTEGAFRESCGMDAWRGHDVTPCYLSHLLWESSPEKVSSIVEVGNNAHRKGLWELSSKIFSMVPAKVSRSILVSRVSGDGIRHFTFSDGFVTDSKVKICKDLHREKALCLTLSNFERRSSRLSWSDFYQWLIESPDPDSKWVSGYTTKNSSSLRKEWVLVY